MLSLTHAVCDGVYTVLPNKEEMRFNWCLTIISERAAGSGPAKWVNLRQLGGTLKAGFVDTLMAPRHRVTAPRPHLCQLGGTMKAVFIDTAVSTSDWCSMDQTNPIIYHGCAQLVCAWCVGAVSNSSQVL